MEAATFAQPYPQIGPATEKLRISNNLSPSSSTFQPPPVGATLNNLGNTCFMNAVLQCITHTVPFVQKLLANDHSTACSDKDGDFCSFCALRSHVYESIVKSGMVVTPRNIAYNLSKISSYFQPGEQQDAHEFLSCLLDSIHTSYIKPVSKDHHHLSYTGDSPVNQIFGGLLRSRLRCLDCGHSSDTYEAIVDLSLEIDDVENLTAALESFTKVEMIDDPDIKFTCEGCKSQVSMEKQLQIEQPPNVIALHLKRFTNIESSALKISKFVKYPIELDLTPFVSTPQENEQFFYELYAIVVHSGSCHYGHYYCNIRTSPSSWYLMNDSLMDVISESVVLDLEAYILFYIKKDSSPWFSSFVESQKIAKMDINMNGSPSSVLDCEENDDTSSSAREASSSNSREIIMEVLEKDEVSSPLSRNSPVQRHEAEANSPDFLRHETEANSPDFLRDETEADDTTSPKFSLDANDKNCVVDSPGRRILMQPTRKLEFDDHFNHTLIHQPSEYERKTPALTQKHVGSKNNNQSDKFLMENAPKPDRSITRIMRTMPNSRRSSLLAFLPKSPEPLRKRPLASKSDQPSKRRSKMSSDLHHSAGKGSSHPGSSKAKSLSPRSLRRILIEDDTETLFKFS